MPVSVIAIKFASERIRNIGGGQSRWIASFALAMTMIFNTPAHAAQTVDATIYTQKGELPLQLELAATPETRVKGLMHRDSLDPLDGMLFLFPTPHDYSFWMKDTRLPLDMLFIDAQRRIVHIEAQVAPYSKSERSSGQAIVAVIELDGGRASAESIAEGDHVRYDWPASFTVQ